MAAMAAATEAPTNAGAAANQDDGVELTPCEEIDRQRQESDDRNEREVRTHRGSALEGEDGLEHIECIAERLRPEEHPRHVHEEEGHEDRRDVPKHNRIVRDAAASRELVDDEVAAVERTPHDEVPRSAVPQPTQEHREHEVAVGGEVRPPVAAERDVQVVAQPVRQRDVPAPPELGDVARQVRLTEVDDEVDAEQARRRRGRYRCTRRSRRRSGWRMR